MAGFNTSIQTPLDAEHSTKTSNTHSSEAHLLHSPSGNNSPRLPQIISHRGYKGIFPENTFAAVQGAVQAGTHALEIDLHISRDGVLVLSHDPSLQRCYGVKKKIADCDWAYLKTLRTLQAPHEPMPRLVDILDYLRQPELDHIWVLLDIKVSDDPGLIMQRISETISSVPPSPTSPSWHKRIILGCWSAVFIPYRNKYLPAYELSLICLFDLKHARQFLHTPNISFNVNRLILMGPLGRGFLEEARAAQHKVYLWTVNAPNLMRWGIRHGVQGIITDDPALYGRVREAWEAEKSGQGKDGVVVNQQLVVDELSFGQRMQIWLVVVIVVLFGWILKRKYHVGVERVQIERKDT